ncbi:MAG TPA: hypothetical protein VHZ24_20775 [Pirellulales bacterium]|jgi:hypothetical protein|nr:hypothetical protein [Pirellulales bacterium]
MSNLLQNLITARDNIAANLAAITANPKPSYSIDGQRVSWQALCDSYSRQLVALNAQIAAADPFEITSLGTTSP